MFYQTLRSVSDNHVFVCKDGEFYSLPEAVRHRGPWQVQHRGELANLNTSYLIDIEEHGYSLVRCELAVFKPEVWDAASTGALTLSTDVGAPGNSAAAFLTPAD